MNVTLNTGHKERKKAILFLIMAAVLWSTSGLLIKLIDWNPVAICGSRSGLAAIVMYIYLKKPNFTWSKTQIGGALIYTATVITFVIANKLTDSANVILLQYTAPIYVAFLAAWFLKERTGWYDWLVIVFVIVGMGLFFIGDISIGNILGNALSILSGICLAILTVILRSQKDGSPLETVLLGNILTFLIGIPFMFQAVPSSASILGILLMGTFQLGLSYILFTKAIKHVTALEGILIPVIEPLLNPVWVFLIVGELPGIWAVIGGVVVLISVTARCILVSKISETESGSESA